ncbi:MAG: BolA family transcriptional regulator [Gammaproteobacteria bacterium]|nr:BolA family transcriptional regulator [Gammaproteobacteria bacterium]MDH5799865.1 BolA family transcriptional regulator [Gammaproteobacteria bacterium]
MENEEVKRLIEAGIADAQVTVNGDGSHYEAIVVGAVFAGKSLLEKQKMVYATLNAEITSGRIHALSIKAYSPEEWEKAQKFQVGGA